MKEQNIFTQQAVNLLAEKGLKLDANETAFLDRELTQLRAKVFDVVYPNLLARSFLPMATDIAATASSFAYKVWDRKGKAKVGANESDDAPRVDVTAREVTGKVFPIIASYGYGVDELAESVRLGTSLDAKRAMAVRDAIEEGVDEMLAMGNTGAPGESNLITQGILDHDDIAGAANVRVIPLTDWTSATSAATFISELNSLRNAVPGGSKQRFRATDIVLPADRYELIASKPYGVDSDRTVLSWFEQNNNIKISAWYRGEGLGVNSNGRAIVYQKDPNVLEGVVPMEFTQLPPQARNYEFVIPCRARCGGVKVYQPLGVYYGDFAA